MESNLSEADKHFIVCTAAVLAVGVFFAGRWAHNAGSRTAQRSSARGSPAKNARFFAVHRGAVLGNLL